VRNKARWLILRQQGKTTSFKNNRNHQTQSVADLYLNDTFPGRLRGLKPAGKIDKERPHAFVQQENP